MVERAVPRVEKAVILTFHGIGRPTVTPHDDDADYWVDTDSFQRILDAVADRHDVSLTFDDGYRSDVDVVLPALLERGLTGRFFPLVGWLSRPESLDETGIKQLRAAGMGVGVHGVTHRKWGRTAPESLRAELDEAITVLGEVTGGPVRAAACPLGSYDRRALAVLRSFGLENVFTSDRAYARPGAWLQPRFTIRRGEGVAEVQEILAARERRVIHLMDDARMLLKRVR